MIEWYWLLLAFMAGIILIAHPMYALGQRDVYREWVRWQETGKLPAWVDTDDRD